MKEHIFNQLSERFCEIGKKLDLTGMIVRGDNYNSEIYIKNNHALQLEIDWYENNLFMYVVYLKNNELPDKNVIYNYEDGQWCRKYLEEIYKTKRPQQKDRSKRYSEQYLFECLDFYEKLIEKNSSVLQEFFKSITK